MLSVSGEGVSPYSSRYITQTLTPIDAAGSFRRTVNGTLVNLSPSQFAEKYKSTISGTDHDSPAFDAINVGDTLTIGCAEYLSYLTSGGSAAKSVVSGSSYTSGNYTFYRPELSMMVVAKSQERGEVNTSVAPARGVMGSSTWSIELEEV